MKHWSVGAFSALFISSAAAGILAFSAVGAASAHGFSSVVYGTISDTDSGQVRAELQLEYDLLVVSAADA